MKSERPAAMSDGWPYRHYNAAQLHLDSRSIGLRINCETTHKRVRPFGPPGRIDGLPILLQPSVMWLRTGTNRSSAQSAYLRRLESVLGHVMACRFHEEQTHSYQK